MIINNVGGGGVGVPMPVPAVPEKGFAPGGAIAIDDSGNPIVNDVAAPDQPFGARQDTLWPKSVAMWLGDVGVLHPALHPGRLADAALAVPSPPRGEEPGAVTIGLPRTLRGRGADAGRPSGSSCRPIRASR